MSQIKVNGVVDASGGNTATINTYTPTESNMMGKNRIINGDMRIDQRNAGASVSTSSGSGVYTVDRWIAQYSATSKFTIQQSSTAPTGFANSVLITSSAATSVGSGDYYLFSQRIEGFNTADLDFGKSTAKTITVSFWVRSSLTGTFGGSLTNDAQDRSYPFTYTISSANTFEYKTVTIAGDTTGTWATNNTCSFKLWFGLGVGSSLSGTAGAWAGTQYLGATGATSVVGTNGATFYITGAQLEAGTVASPFERRDYGRELMLCQRYYEKSFNIGTAPATNIGISTGEFLAAANTTLSNSYCGFVSFRVTKRSNPTVTLFNRANASNNWQWYNSAGTITNGGITGNPTETGFHLELVGNSTSTIAVGHWTASAEL